MAPGLVAVRINEALGPAMRCLGAGEKLELVLSSVEAELWRLRWRLLSQDDVEYELALLYDEAPELIHQVLDRYTLGALTRVLRALLRAGIVLCDLRSILEALMAYAGDTDDVVECVAFVRQRLSSEGIFALMGDSERPLHEIAVSLSGPVDSLTEEEVEALRDGVASELTQSSTSVIVAPLEQREAVRLLLEDELPEVFVVSPGEVPPYPVSHAPGACPSVP
jgi:flagellar biosynthesis component FlhA